MFKVIYWLLDYNDEKLEIIKEEILTGKNKIDVANKAGKQFKKDYPEFRHLFWMDIQVV
jgi:hypothetical protein